MYTPIKGMEGMQNSAYMECNHIDPLAVYD